MPSSPAIGRKLSRPAIVCLSLLVFFVLTLLAVLVFRHGAAAFAVNRVLQDYDLKLTELNGLHIGRSVLSIESAVFHWAGDEEPLRFEDIRVHYTVSGLAAGQLEAVLIDHASVHLPPTNTPAIATAEPETASHPAPIPGPTSPVRGRDQDEVIRMLQELPVQQLHIATLDAAPYLEAATLHLVQTERDIQLEFQFGLFSLSAAINWHDADFVSAYFLDSDQSVRPAASLLSGRIQLSGQSVPPARTQQQFLSADLTLSEQPGEMRIHSAVQLDLDGLQERLAATGLEMPPSLPALGGDLQADISARLDPAAKRIPWFMLRIESGSQLTISDLKFPGASQSADIAVTPGEPLRISGSYPFGNGADADPPALRVEADAIQMLVERLPGAGPARADISDLIISCEKIDACHSEHILRLTLAAYTVPDLELQDLIFTGSVDAELGGGTVRSSLGSTSVPASLTVRQLQANGVELAQAQLDASDPLDVTIADGSIAVSGTRLKLDLPLIRTGSDISQLQLQLPRLALSTGSGLSIDSEFVVLNMVTELVPVNLQSAVLEGKFGFAEDTARIDDGELHLNGQLALQLDASHAIDSATGNAGFVIPGIHFDTLWSRLSNFISPLPVPVDLLSGSIDGQGNLHWQKDAVSQWQISGPVHLNLNALSGTYKEIGFLGVSTSTSLQIAADGVRNTEMHSLEIASIDPGIPIENIRLDYQLDSAAGRYTVRDFYAEVFDGTVSSEGGVYVPADSSNTMLLNLQRINLESMLDMAAYDAVTATGLLSGQLPLTLAETLTVNNGTLVALPPGGYIRYRPQGQGSGTGSGNAGLDLVYQALSNYQYDLLRANVNYQPDGDLLLEVKLEGVNPDMSPGGQAINLNLNIEDNIPALLESLQAARSITDALEARLQTTDSAGEIPEQVKPDTSP